MNRSPQTEVSAAPQTGGVRFAPSPTGRFHIGNLRTAWISYQWSRELGRPWIVRFEDIDDPRVLAGAQDQQVLDLKTLGLVPDLELTQSRYLERHLQLFQLARKSGAVYPCVCSRKEVQTALSSLASAAHDNQSPVYSGECRQNPLDDDAQINSSACVAWRFRMPRLDGRNDFIIARTASLGGDEGFIPAYHWACAIDDFDGAYDLIVRSVDLASALPLQRAIQAWLSSAEKKDVHLIRAFHTSLITQDDGRRLEKRTNGVTLSELLQDGWSVEKLTSAFETSFNRDVLSSDSFDRDEIAHEARAQLSLQDLLVSKF